MARRSLAKGRQTPTRQRLIRVFQRNFVRNGRIYSGCIRFEHLRNRFGVAVRVLLEDLVKHGVLQVRNCGALAYELPISEQKRLDGELKPTDFAGNNKSLFHVREMDLLDLGPSPTSEAREAARNGMTMEVYRLQTRLRLLPLVPLTQDGKRSRERVSRDLLQAARKAGCVGKINLAAGTGGLECLQ